MIGFGKPIGGGVLLSLVICSVSFGTATPYQGIVDRNIFGLKPPPPPAAVADTAPKTPLPPITLTGITTLLGVKRAFLSLQMPAKPPEPAKPQSFMLSEGQRDGDIEMIEIDVNGGSVKLNAFGTITNVPFPKLTASSPSPATGGAPGGATGIPAPPSNPFSPGGNPAFNRAIPSRTLRMPSAPMPGGQPGADASQPNTTSPNASIATPGSGQSGLTTISGVPIPPERSAEENVALYEANRMKNDQLIKQGVPLPRMPQHVLLGRPGQDNAGGQTLSPQ